jgi:hypothetical protein
VLKGLLAAGITMGLAAVFPEGLVYPLFAAFLGLFLGVFPGLAMADPMEGRPGLNWAVAVTILVTGLAGLWGSALLLSGSWVLLGFWGILHRGQGLGKGVPEGLPGFTLSYSLVIAAFIAYMWVAAAV